MAKKTKRQIDEELKKVADQGEVEPYLNDEQHVAIANVLNDMSRGLSEALNEIAGKPVPFALFIWGGKHSLFSSSVERGEAFRSVEQLLPAFKRQTQN